MLSSEYFNDFPGEAAQIDWDRLTPHTIDFDATASIHVAQKILHLYCLQINACWKLQTIQYHAFDRGFFRAVRHRNILILCWSLGLTSLVQPKLRFTSFQLST